MAEALRLKTAPQESTIFNKDMLLGTLAGWTVGGLFGAPLGAVIGGVLGKNRIDRENLEGKIVSKPSFWNKDTVIGALGGHVVGGLAAAAVILTISTKAIIGGALATSPLGMLAIAATLIVGGTLIGANIGGNQGARRMESEYQQAVAQNMAQSVEPSRAPAQEPDLAKAKSFVQELQASRAQQAQRQV